MTRVLALTVMVLAGCEGDALRMDSEPVPLPTGASVALRITRVG